MDHVAGFTSGNKHRECIVPLSLPWEVCRRSYLCGLLLAPCTIGRTLDCDLSMDGRLCLSLDGRTFTPDDVQIALAPGRGNACHFDAFQGSQSREFPTHD